MSATVQDRVTSFVLDHPGRTAFEIALAVRARRQTVQDVLDSPLFQSTKGPKGATVYSLAGATGQPGTAAEPETDVAFLHRVLADREPHSLNEILQRSFRERGCGLTVHSRASDLRSRGFEIVNWKDGKRGDGSWYRLLAEPGLESADGVGASRSTDEHRPGSANNPLDHSGVPAPSVADSLPAATDPDGTPEQLKLTGSGFRRQAA